MTYRPLVGVRPVPGLFERFWRNVRKGPKCWKWTAPLDESTGYGQFNLPVLSPRGPARRSESAHRLAWEMVNGPIPEGLYILHNCNNQACVRPDHLRAGTAKENTHDMMTADRFKAPPFPKGEQHWNATLTKEKVEKIKNLYRGRGRGPTMKQLAKRFGVGPMQIHLIIAEKNWRQVPDPSAPTRRRYASLTSDQVRQIRQGRADGQTLGALSKRFQTSRSNIRSIIARHSWKNVV